MARTIGPYGSSARAGQAAARRTVIGSRRAPIRAIASSRKRRDADAGGPVEQDGPGPPWAASSRAAARLGEGLFAPHEPRARVPGRHGGILRAASARLARDDRPPAPPHPANTLNELPGEEWLYFTKSLLTTAYPSELGHAARKAHGANKPPRLMARLIEFFSRTGELVLDPFAGVGGTLLGAAIARGPRRALGIELEPRWAAVYETRRARPVGRARRPRSGARRPRRRRPGRAAAVRSVGPASCASATRWRSCRPSAGGSVDLVATDPPYNLQLPMTMAGGALAEAHANRRTDYAMVTDSTRRPRQRARLRDLPRPDGRASSRELRRVLRDGRYAVVIVRDAYQDGRYVFTGSDLAARAAAVGLVPKGDLIWYQAGTRLRPYGYPRAFVPTSSTSTSSCCATRPTRQRCRGGATPGRPPGHRLSMSASPIVQLSAAIGIVAVGPVAARRPRCRSTSPRVILWSQPCWPSGARTSQ